MVEGVFLGHLFGLGFLVVYLPSSRFGFVLWCPPSRMSLASVLLDLVVFLFGGDLSWHSVYAPVAI